jgi:hypothetical protein
MSEEKSTPQLGLDTTVSTEPLTIIVPSGALNAQTWTSQAWFYPFLPQTFPGAVSNGVATPTVSGNGYMGTNNNGFVFQNGQYNSKREGSGQ